MRPLPLLLASAAVSAAVCGLILVLQQPASDGGAGAAAELSALRGAVDALRAQNEELRAELAGLRVAGASAAVERRPDLDALVESAVARAMAASRPVQSGTPSADAPRGAAAGYDQEQALGRLLDPMLGQEARNQVWKEAHEAGRTQELIAALEARARTDPRNAALQYELGYAYLQPIIQGEASGPQAGPWSMKADKTFDAVLALDPEHWDARFSKAVSYSFWPPIFGKQQAAIDQFEILVSKQSGMTARPEFAQTYLFLGNLYEQTGNAAKAKQTWDLGLAAFPQSRELRQRLGLE